MPSSIDPNMVLFFITAIAWIGMEVLDVMTHTGTVSGRIQTLAAVFPPLRIFAVVAMTWAMFHWFGGPNPFAQ